MAFTTGTASHHKDLLDKLRLYLVAQGWTQLAWVPGATSTDPSQLNIRGPGAGPGKQVFVNIRTMVDVTVGSFSWEIRSAVDYAAVPWGSQLSESPSQVYLNTWDDDIDYWFYVNDRRFIVIAKCSTDYMSMHAGFFLPWGTPDQYPFPLFVSADFHEQRPASYNYAARRMFVDPGWQDITRGNAWARTPTGLWYPVQNAGRNSGTNNPAAPNKGQACFLWPYNCGHGGQFNIGNNFRPDFWSGGAGSADSAWAGESMVPTQQDERPLIPCVIGASDQASLGALDGVYAVGGTGLTTEQLISVGARDFRIFQNVQRNSGDDFFAVEEV
jgi:hypothetical protein